MLFLYSDYYLLDPAREKRVSIWDYYRYVAEYTLFYRRIINPNSFFLLMARADLSFRHRDPRRFLTPGF